MNATLATRLLVPLCVVSLAGCGGGAGPRAGVARAAITVAPNAVSCTTPAVAAFDAALCVCEDLQLVGSGVSIASSDALATNVGVNGTTHVVGRHDIAGSLASFKGIDDTGHLTVRDDALTTGDVSGVGTLSVGRDLSVGGDLSTVGDLVVGGTLRVAGRVQSVGDSKAPRLGAYTAPAGPPCGCGARQLFDVGAEVDRARTENDNARLGAEPSVDAVGTLALELAGGRFFLKSLSSVGHLKLHVTQPTALFIDGDLETVGTDEIAVDEGASLDLYVKGHLENVGTWRVGQGTLAGVVRLYVGGADPLVQSVGNQDFVGSLYAPTAEVRLTGDTRIRGALFAKSLTGTGSLLIDYAKPAVPAPGSCP